MNPVVRAVFERIRRYAACFQTIEAERVWSAMQAILNYWLQTTNFDDIASLSAALERILSPQWSQQQMNLLEKVQQQAAEAAAAEAMVRGLAEGEAKGKRHGLAEGEASRQRLIASRMLAQGYSAEAIAALTDLTVQAVNALQLKTQS